jgi:hypothetical protein
VPPKFSAEQTWLLADNLARSGRFKDWREVENELLVRDHDRARSLLGGASIRARLDRICDIARVLGNGT